MPFPTLDMEVVRGLNMQIKPTRKDYPMTMQTETTTPTTSSPRSIATLAAAYWAAWTKAEGDADVDEAVVEIEALLAELAGTQAGTLEELAEKARVVHKEAEMGDGVPDALVLSLALDVERLASG